MLDKDEKAIKMDWASVLERQNCIEIYEYLYNVILNEEYPLDKKLALELLDMARKSDLPCEPGPYGNLRKDIEHYIEAYHD